jgi:hypothetical protein
MGVGHQVLHHDPHPVEGGTDQVAPQEAEDNDGEQGPVEGPVLEAREAPEGHGQEHEGQHHPARAAGEGEESKEAREEGPLEHHHREDPLEAQSPGHGAPMDGAALVGQGIGDGHEGRNAGQADEAFHLGS